LVAVLCALEFDGVKQVAATPKAMAMMKETFI